MLRFARKCLGFILLAASTLIAVPPDPAVLETFGEVGTDDFRISHMGPDGNPSYVGRFPDVAYNATNNEYLVVWEGEEIDGEFEIYGQRIDAATGAEVGATDFRISDLGPNGSTLYGALTPAVVWNSVENEYLVVWRGDDDTAPLVDNEMEIFGQLIDGATGAEIGVDFRISDIGLTGDITYGGAEPAVAYNPTLNQYLVVWRGDDTVAPDETEIWGQLLTAAGADTGPDDFRISDSGAPGSALSIATSPHVAYNSTNQEYLVVWHADDLTVDNDVEIFGQRINAVTGAEITPNDFRISDMGLENDAAYRAGVPRVAYNPSVNEYLVVWTGNEESAESADFIFEVYGQRLAGATGNAVGSNDFRISDMGPENPESDDPFDAGRADVSWSPAAGEYLVVWHGDDTVLTEVEVWGQRLDAAGSEVGINDFRLSSMGPTGDADYDAFNPRVAFGANGQALIVWGADDVVDNESEIYGQFYDVQSTLRGDFNGDGNTDLLWRHYGTGAVNAWLLNGTSYLGGASLFNVSDPNWRIEGTGDFNGDGSTDVIWRHYGTGVVNVWFLSGTTYLGGANLFTVADVNWKIQAVGDFNGDGKDDLIWRHYGTGAVNVWFLDGTTYLGGANLFTVADANWRIEVAGDFNGDGKNDLIWRHYGSGAVNVWYLDGTTYLGGVSLFTVAGPSWDIEAVGDYNGDGKNDLIWRNYGTGAVNVWFLNGTTYLGGANLFSVADPNWEIAGPR